MCDIDVKKNNKFEFWLKIMCFIYELWYTNIKQFQFYDVSHSENIEPIWQCINEHNSALYKAIAQFNTALE